MLHRKLKKALSHDECTPLITCPKPDGNAIDTFGTHDSSTRTWFRVFWISLIYHRLVFSAFCVVDKSWSPLTIVLISCYILVGGSFGNAIYSRSSTIGNKICSILWAQRPGEAMYRQRDDIVGTLNFIYNYDGRGTWHINLKISRTFSLWVRCRGSTR